LGRPRTPTSILDAKGAFIHDPQRARPAEPNDDSKLGGPPKYLTDVEKKVWRELARQILPGVAKRSDRTAFETLVRLATKQRLNTLINSTDRAHLMSLYQQFAMTPASRSKVAVEAPKQSALDKYRSKPRSIQPPTGTFPIPAPTSVQ
jgi:phage terminase small subunit